MKLRINSIITALWVLLLVPTLVIAYYKDMETSAGNTFTASTLDTSLHSSDHINKELVRGGTISFIFQINNDGQLPSSNQITFTNISNPALADAIQVTYGTYQAPLSSFTLINFLNQAHGQNDLVTLDFYISEESYDNNNDSNITFKITNNSWAQGQTMGTGFSDVEQIQLTLSNSTPALATSSNFLQQITFENPADILIGLTSPILE